MTKLRYLTKKFTAKKTGVVSTYRYYLIEDITAITGLTLRNIFNLFPYKGMHNLNGNQCIDKTSMSQLVDDYPELAEAIENAEEVA